MYDNIKIYVKEPRYALRDAPEKNQLATVKRI